MLQFGSTGDAVVALQTSLGVATDGVFGHQTEAAVRQYQLSHALTPDGIAGPVTLATIAGEAAHPVTDPKIHGIDIYHDDEISSWSRLAQGGVKFISIKATEGLHYHDKNYAANRAAAKAVGIVSGPYHFVHMDLDPILQARYFADFINANGGLQPDDLMPMLDYETLNGDPYSIKGDPIWVQAFLEEIKTILGWRCAVYVGFSMVNSIGNPAFLAEYPFWLADYQKFPTIPAPWKKYNFWQYTGTGVIPGMGNVGDIDIFNGSLDDLKALIQSCKL